MAIISKKSDYHYSDLSRWGSETVGSDIYPLRPTEQKRVLKFCDVAFLAEALYSRNRAGSSTAKCLSRITRGRSLRTICRPNLIRGSFSRLMIAKYIGDPRSPLSN